MFLFYSLDGDCFIQMVAMTAYCDALCGRGYCVNKYKKYSKEWEVYKRFYRRGFIEIP